jgi:diaminohydroxyphosphoribosylaminopyrimidine deaminase/5-amino-6-(5-phosphoribosylamino)uracil reductase
LKWAQTANGFIDNNEHALAISSPFTQMLSHRLRAEEDAILVGRITDEREHPQLTVRHWFGPDPKRLIIDRQHPLNLESLYDHNIQSLIVEGGRKTLESFLTQNLWDEIRIETATITVNGGTRAPKLPPNIRLCDLHHYANNSIAVYTNTSL